MNSIQIVGNLGKAPELKTGKNGKSFCKFSVATQDGFGDHKKTNWHNVVLFGKTAELANQYLVKGSKVGIIGSVEYSEYEKDGVKTFYTSITGHSMEFLTPKSEGNNTQPQQQNYQQNNAQPSFEQTPAMPPVNDDLPF